MKSSSPSYGMPRRIAAGMAGFAILAFLTWNVSDGVIYLRGDGIIRADNPVGFWIMAIAIGASGCGAIYWAVLESRDQRQTPNALPLNLDQDTAIVTTGDFTFTTGLVGGETYQFADGRWPGVVGAGISMTEESFDLIEPHLRKAAPGWTSDHRYGVFELNASARRELAKRLRTEANMLPDTEAQSKLFNALAAWLEVRSEEWKPVGVFGI